MINNKIDFWDFIISNVDYNLTEEDMINNLLKVFKKTGFKFIGYSVIISFVKSIGLLDPHQKDCQNNFKTKGSFKVNTEDGMLSIQHNNFKIIEKKYINNNIMQTPTNEMSSFEKLIQTRIKLNLDY